MRMRGNLRRKSDLIETFRTRGENGQPRRGGEEESKKVRSLIILRWSFGLVHVLSCIVS